MNTTNPQETEIITGTGDINPCNQAAPAEANIFARELASRAGEILFRKAA